MTAFQKAYKNLKSLSTSLHASHTSILGTYFYLKENCMHCKSIILFKYRFCLERICISIMCLSRCIIIFTEKVVNTVLK